MTAYMYLSISCFLREISFKFCLKNSEIIFIWHFDILNLERVCKFTTDLIRPKAYKLLSLYLGYTLINLYTLPASRRWQGDQSELKLSQPDTCMLIVLSTESSDIVEYCYLFIYLSSFSTENCKYLYVQLNLLRKLVLKLCLHMHRAAFSIHWHHYLSPRGDWWTASALLFKIDSNVIFIVFHLTSGQFLTSANMFESMMFHWTRQLFLRMFC